MKNTLVFDRKALATLLVALVWGAVCSTIVQAQTAGETGICNTTTTACPQADVTGSVAVIDASAVTQGANICDTIYNIISAHTFQPGTVIDARGISSNLTCSSSESPWLEGTTYENVASTILLPAQTIVIKYPWILPSGTKLIGEGPGATTIEVCGTMGCFSGSWMIEFAQSTARGVSVENLTLQGNPSQTTPGGILNEYAQDSSYVDHVDLYEILGTGLEITGNAQNSGPYSNITYNTNNNASSSATCVDLYNVSGGTRGIHGLTCLGDSSDHAPVAVYLDSSNNSLEDVTIAGFGEGVVVGSQSAAQSNILVNIVGDTNQGIVAVTCPLLSFT